MLDRLSTYVDPLVLAGDLNIRLERTADPHTVEFCKLLDSYGLVQQVHDITHDAGGTPDVVCSRGDLPSPSVDVHEIGLSHTVRVLRKMRYLFVFLLRNGQLKIAKLRS